MNIKCPQCGYDSNLPSTEFCEVCGYELSSIALNSHQHSEPVKIEEEPNYPSYFKAPTTEIQPPEAQTSPSSISSSVNAPIPIPSIQTIKLISKQAGSPISEFVLEDSNIIGRFDPDLGPVEIDLEGFVGADYISRNHAEIYREGSQWKIKDLGSENGVFLKRVDQTRFSARITTPEILNIGDEVAFGRIRFVFQSS
ncbi:MAG: FHA domain-containing protein [Desmonostoc vinosum HA7617-LM4]|nr:FHA domain-containing protein [Desmonostoc vinosum HA7617-LM4]